MDLAVSTSGWSDVVLNNLEDDSLGVNAWYVANLLGTFGCAVLYVYLTRKTNTLLNSSGRAQDSGELFTMFDKNHDGKLSRVESANLDSFRSSGQTVIGVGSGASLSLTLIRRLQVLGAVHVASAVYAAVFPTRFMGWYVWWKFPLANVLLAFVVRVAGQVAWALLLYYVLNYLSFEISTAMDFNGPMNFRQVQANVVTAASVCVYVGLFVSVLGLTSQNWLCYALVAIARIIGFLLFAVAAFRIFNATKQIRIRRAWNAGLLVDYTMWCAESVGFSACALMLVMVGWYAFVLLPEILTRYQYQQDNDVPTLGLFDGLGQAIVYSQKSQNLAQWPAQGLFWMLIENLFICLQAVGLSAGPRMLQGQNPRDFIKPATPDRSCSCVIS